MFNHFRIAGRNTHSRLPCRLRHSTNFRFKNRRRQARFENIGNNQGLGPGARDRKIVHGTVDREFTNGASGKTQRLDHKTVSRDRNFRTIDVDLRGVSEGPGNAVKKQGSEQAFNQLAAGFASSSMRHLDLRIAKPDGDGLGFDGGRGDLSV